MLCVSIMTNAYIIGFMSPRVELQQESSVQSDRSGGCLLSGRRNRRQNSSNQLIKSFSRFICLGQTDFKWTLNLTEHLELSRIKNRREASFSFVGKTMIPADCWGLAHCILDVGTWHYGDNMSGVRLSGLGDHLHLLNSKHYHTEKEIFSLEKYFPFSDNFLILSIEKFVYIMKGVLLFSLYQTILFLCSPFCKSPSY